MKNFHGYSKATTISLKDFIAGCVAIHMSEKDTENDEFTPNEFKNV
jgi:hypothetical protein